MLGHILSIVVYSNKKLFAMMVNPALAEIEKFLHPKPQIKSFLFYRTTVCIHRQIPQLDTASIFAREM